MNPKRLLEAAKSILIIDWPNKDVPASLARAGLVVAVQGGPGPEDYSAYEMNGGEVIERRVGHPPAHVDIVYAHRPLSELRELTHVAKRLGAKTIWMQSGANSTGARDPKGCWLPDEDLLTARGLVKAVGLELLTEPYIGDVARELAVSRSLT